jgi:hypothetical protein
MKLSTGNSADLSIKYNAKNITMSEMKRKLTENTIELVHIHVWKKIESHLDETELNIRRGIFALSLEKAR